MDYNEYEFEITSNRPDCMSVIGLAREAAATFDLPLKLHTPEIKKTEGDINDYVSVEVENTELCSRYAARVIKDVEIKESPNFIKARLIAAGIRPINNVVDITNYILILFGQPLHAFDLSKLTTGKIVVKNATEGEKFTTLDEVERTLDKDMLVITDGEKSIALAGVMGGLNSEIDDNTTEVLLEGASFKRENIRATSKKLGLRTEASGR